MTTEPATTVVLSATVIGGTLRSVTAAERTFLRKKVPVQHALPPNSDDDPFGDTPLFSPAEQAYLRTKRVVPLRALRKILSWVNQLTVNPGESAFDFPSTDGVLRMLQVVTTQYTDENWPPSLLLARNHNDAEPEVVEGEVLVPVEKVNKFLDQLSEGNSREEVVTALDAFVAQHMCSTKTE